MWTAAVLHPPVSPFAGILTAQSSHPALCTYFPANKHRQFRLLCCSSPEKFEVSGSKKPHLPDLLDPKTVTEVENVQLHEQKSEESDLGWFPAFPHVLVASTSNFLFGFHIGVMNGPIVSIARDLGFEDNSILEGLVVSIFIAGAFIGSVSSGSLVDRIGFRRTLQVDTIPLILGAIISAQAHSLDELLWGRFLVGLGIGVNTVLVPIYISEVKVDEELSSLVCLFQSYGFPILPHM